MIVNTVRQGNLKCRVIVPDGAAENTWRYGVLIGPPDLAQLGLPSDVEVRLNNELFNRGLITKKDLRKRGHEITAALQAALKVDAQAIMFAYEEGE